ERLQLRGIERPVEFAAGGGIAQYRYPRAVSRHQAVVLVDEDALEVADPGRGEFQHGQVAEVAFVLLEQDQHRHPSPTGPHARTGNWNWLLEPAPGTGDRARPRPAA